jgi:hypothetical protein
VIRVYDAAGNVMKMHEHAGDFKEPREFSSTYLVGMKESGNQKYNFSYLANTKGVQKISC